jgi:hypothetical protein
MAVFKSQTKLKARVHRALMAAERLIVSGRWISASMAILVLL